MADGSPKKWDRLPITMGEKRKSHAAVVLNDDRILLTGGVGDGGDYDVLDSVEIINIQNHPPNIDSNIPTMSSKRYLHASVTVDNNIYVIGGCDAGGLCKT